MRKIVFFLTLFFCYSTYSYAADRTVIEQSFSRIKGQPNYYSEKIIADRAGLGFLEIYNGDSSGDHRTSSASVILNGQQLIFTDDLNYKVGKIVKDVNFLEGENFLEVEIAGAPGSVLTALGQYYYDADSLIDSTGGTVSVVDPDSLISGASVAIPADAVEESVVITIDYDWFPPEPPSELAPAGEAVEFGPEGLTFTEPVLLSLPYNDANNDGIVDGTLIDEVFLTARYFNEGTGEWEPVEVVGRDPLKNILTIQTNYFSLYSPFFYANNEVSTVTNPVSSGAIIVDGNPSDWAGLIPTPLIADPIGDSACEVDGTDIESVYTAMDNTYAYFMIKTNKPIHDGMTVELQVDTKEGKNLSYSTYGDYGLNFHGHVGYGDFLTSCWNDDGSVFKYYPSEVEGEHDVDGSTVWGSVVEARIPLNAFDNPKYINIVSVSTQIESYENRCDMDNIYPTLNFFRLQYRLYDGEPDKDHVRLIFTQQSRLGEVPQGVDYIKDVIISKTDDSEFNSMQFTRDDFIAFTEIDGSGHYSELALLEWGQDPTNQPDIYGAFYYGDFSDNTYFIKRFYFDDPYGQIEEGDYKMSLTATDGNTYEALYRVNPQLETPAIDSDTVDCSIDEDGGLVCSWEIGVFEGYDQSRYNSVAEFKAYSYDGSPMKWLGVFLRYLKFTSHELKHDLYMPKEILDKLTEVAEKLTLTIRTRTNDDLVRSYSFPVDLSNLVGPLPLPQ